MKKAVFNELLESIRQVQAIHEGRLKPGRVIHYEPVRVRAIRKKLHVSQSEFALLIGVSVATLRNWEQGRTQPEGAARALLTVADKRPQAVLEALHAA